MRRIAAACIGFLLIWPAASIGQIRTWTDVTGKHKTRAEVLDVKDGVVRLRKDPTGTVIAVPLVKLSLWDQRLANLPEAARTAYIRHQEQEIAKLEVQLQKAREKLTATKRARLNPHASDAQLGTLSRLYGGGLTNAQRSGKDTRLYFRNATARRKARRECEAVIAQRQAAVSLARAGKPCLSDLKPGRLSLGAVGSFRVRPNYLKVLQVTGPDAMLIALYYRKERLVAPSYRSVPYGPVLTGKPFRVRRFSTAGFVDDQLISLDGIFLVVGTEQYATVGGSTKTVFVLEPMPAL